MIACLRLFTALCLAALLAACASSPSSSLGELPRTPDASLEQLLQQASETTNPEKAALLRLSAADLAQRQQNTARAAQILGLVALDQLKPAQQVFANTLAAELAMSRNDHKAALAALNHPSTSILGNCQPTCRCVPIPSTPSPSKLMARRWQRPVNAQP